MDTKTIYVGNIPAEATEMEVKALFEPFGAVGMVKIIKQEGRTPFGFVEGMSAADADKAIAAAGTMELNGTKLVVNEARPRAPRTDDRRMAA